MAYHDQTGIVLTALERHRDLVSALQQGGCTVEWIDAPLTEQQVLDYVNGVTLLPNGQTVQQWSVDHGFDPKATGRRIATESIDGNVDLGYNNRAVQQVSVNEVNNIRKRIRDMDSAVAAATSLADLKTRWSSLSAMPDRTLAQAKQAYKNALADATLDE